jgi:hypothetical protein
MNTMNKILKVVAVALLMCCGMPAARAQWL